MPMTSEPTAEDDVEMPEVVHWSPRHGATLGLPGRMGPLPIGALGLAAILAVSAGALAVGVLAIGRLAVGQTRLGDVKIGRLEIGDLIVVRRNGRAF